MTQALTTQHSTQHICDPVEEARLFARVLLELDRQARRSARSVPTPDELSRVIGAFWELMDTLRNSETYLAPDGLDRARVAVREVLNPWLLRSRLWARAYHKPHGFAGDYRMIEWMYDLEGAVCVDPGQPAVVNALDAVFATTHSVRAVWHRRHWFSSLIRNQGRVGPPMVLDVASGGSRYTRDLIEAGWADVQLTPVDQDPAAIAYIDSWLPAYARSADGLLCCPVIALPQYLGAPPPRDDGRVPGYDVTISTGLFDYLADDQAANLLAHMARLTRPGGNVAICNFSPQDQPKVVKDWVADWKLIYRDPAEVVALFPSRLTSRVTTTCSPDRGLVYASCAM